MPFDFLRRKSAPKDAKKAYEKGLVNRVVDPGDSESVPLLHVGVDADAAHPVTVGEHRDRRQRTCDVRHRRSRQHTSRAPVLCGGDQADVRDLRERPPRCMVD